MQRLADYKIFWREFRNTFSSTGAILPSGKSLSRALARYIGPDHEAPVPSGEPPLADSGLRILEVGPGTGPVTTQIIQRMRHADTLDLVELNQSFVARLRKRLEEDSQWRSVADRVVVHHVPIEQLPPGQHFDRIISGLPLNNFSCELVEQILAQFHRLAAPAAMVSFFQYVGVRKVKSLFSRPAERERLVGIGKILNREFSSWQAARQCIAGNVPPAWVHHLQLPGEGS
jgi:phosphatidylethanolamine/phosphatidyl-N-methylethanolamine N-methyltransferase